MQLWKIEVPNLQLQLKFKGNVGAEFLLSQGTTVFAIKDFNCLEKAHPWQKG